MFKRLAAFLIATGVSTVSLEAGGGRIRADEVYFLRPGRNVVYNAPGGESLFEISRPAHVIVGREIDEWVNVRFEVWVRRDALNITNETDIQLVSYERTEVSSEGAVYMLTVKNVGDMTVKFWDGLLTVRNIIEQPIFRVRLKNKNLSIEPGGEYTVKAQIEKEFLKPSDFEYIQTADEDLISMELIILELSAE